MLSKLAHPNIIKAGKFLSNAEIKGMKFCAIELELADVDLFDRMSEVYPDLIGSEKIRKYFNQLASAIDYLHNQMNIAHNDIKLENVFLFKATDTVKLADFGFARHCSNWTAEAQKGYWKHRCLSLLSPEILKLIKSNSSSQDLSFDEK